MHNESLYKVSILLKTFLRDAYLSETVAACVDVLPEVTLIVVDDGDFPVKKLQAYDLLKTQGHTVLTVPFDSGFGYKSNVGAAACKTEYLLIGADDFDFRPPFVRAGIEKMAGLLDAEPGLAVACGDVAGGGHLGSYQFNLTDEGTRIIESKISLDDPQVAGGVLYHRCDLSRNYLLLRSSILGPNKVRWDDDVKIGGGEHGAFFLDVKRAGHKVAYIPDAIISEQSGKATDPRYGFYRGRARRPQRECFEHRGILEYITPGGGHDYDARNGVPR